MMLAVVLYTCIELAASQALWTPIFVDGTSQVDLWTQTSEGCRCGFDSTKKNCACCVKEGGCQCGNQAPHRCAQCGIQHFCTNMCNMTLDARVLISKSGKSFGQLKSPSVQGPTLCWYSFVPEENQRVEIQIYRLISVGKFNGSSCESGFVQLVDGLKPEAKQGGAQVCGANERFTPPVLFFADKGVATLLFWITESTLRSQFMAYYSFTVANNSIGAGFRPRGGNFLDKTDCDWTYHENGCKEGSPCLLSSPGYPGMYPPNKRCLYYITSSEHSTIRINFKALSLPHNHCNNDNVKIYGGATTSSPVIALLCGNKKQIIHQEGPNLLIEFNSGSSIHPFDYSGFVASLDFLNTVSTTALIIKAPVKTTPATLNGGILNNSELDCSIVFYGNESRSGHFDSRSQQWHENCSMMFLGRKHDRVYLTLINYQLRSPSCHTMIEVYTKIPHQGTKPFKRICSPVKKSKESSKHVQETFISTSNVLVLILKRHVNAERSESEFVDGSFIFHDEHLDGTLQPNTVCHVHFYGESSVNSGHIKNPGNQPVIWGAQPSPVTCTQTFTPSDNQSVTVKVVSLSRLSLGTYCETACGDSGCRCLPKNGILSDVDHIMLTSQSGKPLSCLCGDFQQQWLPVGLRSWSTINLIYSVAQSIGPSKGFHFQADYIFHKDTACGYQVMSKHSGKVTSSTFEGETQLNYYYHQICNWILDSNVERQLIVEIGSTQNRPCTSWNISLHEYNEMNQEKIGALLQTFCPRHASKTYELPWKLNIIVVRLNAMTRVAPEFTFSWKSQIVRSNTKWAGVTPALSSIAMQSIIDSCFVFIFPLIRLMNL